MTIRIVQSVLGGLAIGVAVALAGVSSVRADELSEDDPIEVSHGHFDRGVEYVQDGDLRAALIEFKRAYAASPNYKVLYNLGQVSNELREYIDAQAFYRRYLTDGGNEIEPARRRDVESTLGKLSGRIANLMLSSNIVGAELFVDDVSVGTTPLSEPVRVSAGARVIAASVGGRPRLIRTIEAAGGDTLVVQLDFPQTVDHETLPGPSSAPRRAESGGPGPVLWLGIGAGALGVATGVMAILAANDAAKYHDAVDTKTTARELQDLDDRATAKALVTDILLGATVVATTITIIVATAGSDERESPRDSRAHAQLRLGPGAVSLSGDF
jgi:tetratricopeptide (TPR) repeat protein